jgi:quinol monooxygenase YgiN
MSNTIRIMATIEPLPGSRDEVQRIIESMIVKTRTEAGCLMFDLLQGCDDLETLYLWEEFEDAEALERHLAQPYTQEVFEKIGPHLKRSPRPLYLHVLR